MSGHYDAIRRDITKRKAEAEAAGLGFDLPATLGLERQTLKRKKGVVVPIEPKIAAEREEGCKRLSERPERFELSTFWFVGGNSALQGTTATDNSQQNQRKQSRALGWFRLVLYTVHGNFCG
jgi:hypothetical protein